MTSAVAMFNSFVDILRDTDDAEGNDLYFWAKAKVDALAAENGLRVNKDGYAVVPRRRRRGVCPILKSEGVV